MEPSARPPYAKKYLAILIALCHSNKGQRLAIIQKAKSGLIKCICECALNLLLGNVPLTEVQKNKLRRYAKILRKLASRGGTWEAKKNVIVEKDGRFLPLLLSPIFDQVTL